jgi:hypothetical protein
MEKCKKVVFWLKNEDITVPMELLITPGPWKSKTGKFKWLNNQGQETWAEENADGSCRYFYLLWIGSRAPESMLQDCTWR